MIAAVMASSGSAERPARTRCWSRHDVPFLSSSRGHAARRPTRRDRATHASALLMLWRPQRVRGCDAAVALAAQLTGVVMY